MRPRQACVFGFVSVALLKENTLALCTIGTYNLVKEGPGIVRPSKPNQTPAQR